jgi:hypothetical protein
VPDDLDRGYRAHIAAIPQSEAGLQDGGAEALVDVGQRRGRCSAELIKKLRHASLRECVAGSQYGGKAGICAAIDGIGEEVEGGFGTQKQLAEREQLPSNLGNG